MLEHHLQYLEEYEKAELEAKELTANLAQLRSDYGLAGYRSEPHQGKKGTRLLRSDFFLVRLLSVSC